MNSLTIPTRLFVTRRSPGFAAERVRYERGHGVISISKSSRHSLAEIDHSAGSPGPAAQSIERKLIWFHHIKSSRKKRDITEWGAELKLGGYCKPGFPGVLIFEGEAKNVAEYVRRIKRLKWQHLQVRGQEEEILPASQELDLHRRFPHGVKLLPESGMSELAAICRKANLESLYLTAFKIVR